MIQSFVIEGARHTLSTHVARVRPQRSHGTRALGSERTQDCENVITPEAQMTKHYQRAKEFKPSTILLV